MPILAINGGTPVRTKNFPAYRTMGEEEKAATARVIDSGVISRYLGCWHEDFYGGPEVKMFEKEWAAWCGAKHAIAVNSNTSGVICALGAAGIGPGDEVIVSPYSMIISATMPLWYGAIPVFADIEPDYFCLDPESVRSKITPRTKAIIVVDIFGQSYNVEAINAIAKEHNLIVIEDAAQAPGAMYKGKHVGTLGHMGVYSLNYHKHIHTGEGGIIVTDDDELANKLQLIRNHAEAVVGDKGETNLVNMLGHNFRLTELQAAIGREQLKKLEKLNAQRVANCEFLAEELSKIPGIHAPKVREGGTHVYYVQPFTFIEAEAGIDRNTFIDAVRAELPATELRELEGQQLSYGFAKPIYLQPIFQKRIAIGKDGWPWRNNPLWTGTVSYEKGICPVTERMFEKELFLHEFMRPPATREDLQDVVAAFKKVYEHKDELKK